jgi:transposase-like protein
MFRNIMRRTLRCSTNSCRKELSIRYGTFFYGSKLECRKLLLIGYLWIDKVPIQAICQEADIARPTACSLVDYFRKLVESDLEEEDTLIGGEGVIVEIDESKLGKRKYNRGHVVDGAWVIGGVEKTPERKVFLVPIEQRNRESLLPVILQHVRQGSIVRTDLWRAYSTLSEVGYQHETVNHSQNFTDPETGVNTNTIEGTWNGLKIQIRPRNRTREGITEHLMEFIWRRKNCNDLWLGLLSALKNTYYSLE